MKTSVIISLLIFLGFSFLSLNANADKVPHKAWTEDLQTLLSHLETAHPNLYHSTDKASLRAALHAAEIPTSTNERYIALAKAMAMIGDGHSIAPLITLPFDTGSNFQFAPIQLKQFSDGVFVIAASTTYKHLIGIKLSAVNGQAVEKVLENITPLVSGDNEHWKQDISSYYLSNLNVVNWATNQLQEYLTRYEFEDEKNGKLSIRFPISESIQRIKWIRDYFIVEDSSRWHNAKPNSPLHQCQTNYCREILSDEKTMYLNIRALLNDERSFETFIDETFSEIDEASLQNLIIDLRLNRGGNGTLRWPLIYKLINHRINTPNNLLVLTSPKVFSAGMMLAVDLEKHTKASFIGEPTGSSPNHYGETTVFELPNSKFKIIHSSLYWQNSRPDDKRNWIEPDAKISNLSAFLFSSRDEAFDLSLNYLKRNEVEFDPIKSKSGKVLIYNKSNIDGSNPAKIAVYYHDDYIIEAFKWHENNDHATIVKASFDPKSLLVSRFEAARLDRHEGEKVMGILTAKDNFNIAIKLGNFKQNFKTNGAPWHSYDFDFSSLGYIYAHLKNKNLYEFQVHDLDMSMSPPRMKNFGSVTLKKLKEERTLNRKAIKYSINGDGLDNRGGYIWFDKKSGVLLRYEIEKPDESNYTSGKLELDEIKRFTDEEWIIFKNSSIH